MNCLKISEFSPKLIENNPVHSHQITQRFYKHNITSGNKTKRSHQSQMQQRIMNILEETGINSLYSLFAELDEAILKAIDEQQNAQVFKLKCMLFHKKIEEAIEYGKITENSHNQNLNSPQISSPQADQVRELLGQIYCLKKQLNEYECQNFNMGSIASSLQFANAQQLLSKHSQVAAKEKKVKIMDKQIVYQMKKYIYEVISEYWKTISWMLPQQSEYLLQLINQAYRRQMRNIDNAGCLDQLQILVQTIKMCQQGISQFFSDKDC